MTKILNFGSLNLDYVYAVPHFVSEGETLSSDSLTVNCGGKGLNQSIAAAKAGAQVFQAGKIGLDGGILTDALNKYGVDTSFVAVGEAKTGHAVIQVDQSGKNCILLFAGCNRLITEDEIDNVLSHFSEGDYLMLQNEINNIPYIMHKASEMGLKTVFNPSPVTDDIADFPLDTVSLFILNEIEGKALSGESNPDKIISALHRKYPKADILLTLGSKGSVYYGKEGTFRTGIYKVTAKDTTAAGDTMTGYFVASLIAGLDPKAALLRSTVASGIAVSHEGAAKSIPESAEVEKALKKMNP